MSQGLLLSASELIVHSLLLMSPISTGSTQIGLSLRRSLFLPVDLDYRVPTHSPVIVSASLLTTFFKSERKVNQLMQEDTFLRPPMRLVLAVHILM